MTVKITNGNQKTIVAGPAKVAGVEHWSKSFVTVTLQDQENPNLSATVRISMSVIAALTKALTDAIQNK